MAINLLTNISTSLTSGYLIDAKNIKGIFFTVQTLEELSNLPKIVYNEGVHIYVTEKNAEYMYSDGDWVQVDDNLTAGSRITISETSVPDTYRISADLSGVGSADYPYDYSWDYA